jgi:hypothetical protein
MKDYMKLIGALALFALTATLFWLFFLPLFTAGKLVNREAQKFDAETSAQVYDNSRQYQQGINRDLARYCREYRDAEGAGRKAVADLILTTADTYQGPLTPSNQACLEEID